MKKKMLNLSIVAMVSLGVGAISFGEETKTEDSNVAEEQVVSEEITDKAEYALAITKSDIEFILKKMNTDQRISQEKLTDFLNRLSQVKTVNEATSILEEATRSTVGTFDEQTYQLRERVNGLVEEGKFSKEEGNEFLKRIEACKTTEELNTVSMDIETKASLADWGFDEYYINTKIVIEEYLKQGKLSQEQADGFMKKLDNCKTVEEMWNLQQDITTQVKFNEDMGQWSFSEKLINIKANINEYVKQGKLTKKQGEDFLAQVEVSKTAEELDGIWQAIEKQIAENEKGTQESTKKEDKKVDDKNKLPQTGESRTLIFTALGVIILGIAGIYFVKRNKK